MSWPDEVELEPQPPLNAWMKAWPSDLFLLMPSGVRWRVVQLTDRPRLEHHDRYRRRALLVVDRTAIVRHPNLPLLATHSEVLQRDWVTW